MELINFDNYEKHRDEYAVTIYCLTFNHEKYVRQTLDGFVSQKTDFRYRVIVHDDASTDSTAEILREYAEKYPDIICLILQDKNQYSQGVNISVGIISPMVHEKYAAICEGDDLWSDENKLQLCFDYLEAHPNCSLCVHDTERIDGDGRPLGKLFNGSSRDIDYHAPEIISAGGGGLFHTSAFFGRREVIFGYYPDFAMKSIGDYPRAIYAATKGYVHYIGRVMSCYRVNTGSSWSTRIRKDRSRMTDFCHSSYSALKRMDDLTDHRYKKAFSTASGRYYLAYVYFARRFPPEVKMGTFLVAGIRYVFSVVLKPFKKLKR